MAKGLSKRVKAFGCSLKVFPRQALCSNNIRKECLVHTQADGHEWAHACPRHRTVFDGGGSTGRQPNPEVSASGVKTPSVGDVAV